MSIRTFLLLYKAIKQDTKPFQFIVITEDKTWVTDWRYPGYNLANTFDIEQDLHPVPHDIELGRVDEHLDGTYGK